MYWLLSGLLAFVFAPWPVGARITRPDPKKNEWVFACSGWRSLAQEVYAEMKKSD